MLYSIHKHSELEPHAHTHTHIHDVTNMNQLHMNADSNGAHFSESNSTVILQYRHFKSLLILGGGAGAI